MMLFDSINAVKNIFHSILDVVISFPFVKAIFQNKMKKKFETFQAKQTFIRSVRQQNKIYICSKERAHHPTAINKYKAMAMNDLNANKYTKHLSAIVKSHEITRITWVKHSQIRTTKWKTVKHELGLFFTLFCRSDSIAVILHTNTFLHEHWPRFANDFHSAFASNKYIFKFGCNGF